VASELNGTERPVHFVSREHLGSAHSYLGTFYLHPGIFYFHNSRHYQPPSFQAYPQPTKALHNSHHAPKQHAVQLP
jgi:hypothetical protein